MAPSASATLLSGSGTGLAWILSLLIPKARSLAEVLNTNFEISAVSLLMPKNCAEFSSACEEVPGIEKLPNKVLLLSNAAIKPTKLGVPFTAICAQHSTQVARKQWLKAQNCRWEETLQAYCQ